MKPIFNQLLIIAMIMVSIYPVMSQPAEKLIEVANFGRNQPIGVAVAPATNRLFVSFPHREPFLYALTEIVNGKRKPFPNQEWNKFTPGQDATHFVNVQDLFADNKNCLWVLDSKPMGNADSKFKLVKIDLTDNHVMHVYTFNDIDKSKSALNDMCIDNDKQLAYLSDPGQHALVVLNLKTGKSRVVLKDDRSTIVQPGLKLHLDDKDVVDDQGNPFVSNVNGIALTADNKYFYFRAINQTKLYRIETVYLADASLTDKEISAKVELVAETGICHGMIADKRGNVYLSDSPDHAIQYVTPDRKVHFLVKDERLSWPDSFGIGNDGYLYLSSSQMNRLPKFNNGQDKVEYPFRIYRIKLPNP
jgi:sugar lactone lactonase YvrE